jgi:hypothetical protein
MNLKPSKKFDSKSLRKFAVMNGHCLLDLWRSGEAEFGTLIRGLAESAVFGVKLEELGASVEEIKFIRTAA